MEEKNLLIVENDQELIKITDRLLSDDNYRKYRLAEDMKWAYRYVETYDGNACIRICDEINALFKHGRKGD